jgi:hypothetical protein
MIAIRIIQMTAAASSEAVTIPNSRKSDLLFELCILFAMTLV